MLKFLVVIWFLYTMSVLFYGHPILNNINKMVIKSFKGIDDNTKTEDISETQAFGIVSSLIIMFIYGILALLTFILDYFMMFSMLKYDSTYITIIFIGLSLFSFIFNTICSKIKSTFSKKEKQSLSESMKSLEDESKKSNKITFKKLVLRIINALYWGYALYLLFL